MTPPADRLARLPRDRRGLPIPYFTAIGAGGQPDFRAVDERKRLKAIRKSLCGLCGEHIRRSEEAAFVGGPRSALGGTYGELPAHRECAEAAMRLCPYIFHAQTRRTFGDGHALPGSVQDKPPFFVMVLCRSWHVVGVKQDQRGMWLVSADTPGAEQLMQPRRVTQVLAYFYRNGTLDTAHPHPQDVSLVGRLDITRPLEEQPNLLTLPWAGAVPEQVGA